MDSQVLKDSRHEAFAQEIASGKDAKSAYMKIYPSCKPASAKSNSSRLLKKVQERVLFLKQQNAERSLFSRIDILQNLQEIVHSAKYDADKIRALELMAKMQGFMENRMDIDIKGIAPIFLSPDGTGNDGGEFNG